MDSFKGIKRTDYCGEIREEQIGKEVVVCGWCARQRDLGGLIFIDLRDRTGLVQCVFDKTEDEAAFEKAFSVRAEFVLACRGVVRARAGAKNDRLATGALEILVSELRVLSAAQTPPFEIVENSNTSADLRLKYRYLDLRRPDLQRNIMLRAKATKVARDYFYENGFLEIETPMLMKSTPEGARDYLVPSRVHKGSFYALPQSPQIYKQLLMLSGYDRYMQIVRCFRDEDLRADRQPEFTQIDLEMSFVDEEDVMRVNEGFLARVFEECIGVKIETPFLRLTYREAMERFGSDKPDMRFGYELCDLSEAVRESGFKVFREALAAGGSVRAINVKGGASVFTRKEIDKLQDFVKTYRAKGLAFIRMTEEISSSFLKFLSEEEKERIFTLVGAEPGDAIFVVADRDKVVFDALGALRCECAKRMGVLKEGDYKFLWVTEFPLLEYDEEEGRYVAMHHPFTAPMEEDIPKMDTAPGEVRARAYDCVLNGIELGGGSIRIFQQELQQKMFELIGFDEAEAKRRFGHLLEAFKYGAPPHGGLAYGLDRLMMLMAGEESIRDVIAFPKVQNASEPMSACPSEVDAKQLEELGLAIVHADQDGENS